jgi:uncharacterized protein YggE
MKRIARECRFLVPVVLAILPLGCSQAAAETKAVDHDESEGSPRSIAVSGKAEVSVVPDEVHVSLGVESVDKKLSKARKENDKKIKKMLGVMKSMKIPSKDIQTSQVSIWPDYHGYHSTKEFLGYRVSKTVSVKLNDIALFEEMLSQVLDAGVNNVNHVNFTTTKNRKHRDRARALAIQAAREKAKDMAKELGQKIGKPLSIEEVQESWWAPSLANNYVEASSSAPADFEGTFAPGQVKMSAQVRVTFELIDQ